MIFQSNGKNFNYLAPAKSIFASLVFAAFAAIGASAQTETVPTSSSDASTAATAATAATQTAQIESEPAPPMPVMQDYKGVKIGMTEDEVRDKLGRPESSDASGMVYELSRGERAQIGLDGDKKVRLIVVFYSPESESRPAYADIFGPGSTAPAKEDGSIYNMIQYPQAGYWVAYNKGAGESGLVIVTMQKL